MPTHERSPERVDEVPRTAGDCDHATPVRNPHRPRRPCLYRFVKGAAARQQVWVRRRLPSRWAEIEARSVLGTRKKSGQSLSGYARSRGLEWPPMDVSEMSELKENIPAFVRWLDEALPMLTASNSVNVHISELLSRHLSAQEQVEASVDLFGWALSNLAAKLAGRIVMLIVPLQNSAAIDPSPPAWTSLASQLSRTPPSIYVMEVTAFLQADPAHRYITSAEAPDLVGEPLATYYQCWRLPDDPGEDGWARDVRILSTRLLQA